MVSFFVRVRAFMLTVFSCSVSFGIVVCWFSAILSGMEWCLA
jgi:hypothetical protein